MEVPWRGSEDLGEKSSTPPRMCKTWMKRLFTVFLCEAESIADSRPSTKASVDPNNLGELLWTTHFCWRWRWRRRRRCVHSPSVEAGATHVGLILQKMGERILNKAAGVLGWVLSTSTPSTEVPSGVPISFRTNGTTIDIFVILSPSPPTVLKTNWKLFLLCLPYLHTTLARVAAHIQNTGGMSRNILTKNKRSTFFYPTKYSDSFIFWIDHCFLMKQWLCRQKTLVTQSGETVGFD